jgi:hypothetical protein
MPKTTTCNLDGRLVEVSEALQLRDRAKVLKAALPLFRCRECGEQVRPHKRGTTGQEAHFEHRVRNLRCSLGS